MSIPFLAIYLTAVQGASASYAGLVIAASSSVGILASFYGGYISDKFGRKNMMLVSIFGWMLVFAGFAAASNLWVFFVVNALNGLCKSLFEPASKALLSDMTEEKTRLLVFNLRYAVLISALSSDLCLAYISAHRNRLRPFWCLQSFTDYTELCLPSNLKNIHPYQHQPSPEI
nr:MFS transporter [Bacillus subtilis]